MAQAAAKNFGGLLALRILSGAFEAIADPAFMLITSMYFTRAEQPTRISIWYAFNGVGVAGGGLIGECQIHKHLNLHIANPSNQATVLAAFRVPCSPGDTSSSLLVPSALHGLSLSSSWCLTLLGLSGDSTTKRSLS